MKIITYTLDNNPFSLKRMGILLDQENIILDPTLCYQEHFKSQGFYNYQDRANRIMPSSLHQLLTEMDSPIERLNECLQLYNKYQYSCTISLEALKLQCPLENITAYRDFYTHEKHVQIGFKKRGEEIPKPWFEMPVFYKGNTASFSGTNSEILWPSYSSQLDYELELAIVTSKDGRNIKSNHAKNHIFGFTILNDISARDMQKKEMMVRLGPSKGKDFCNILGPVIVTYDEFNFSEPDLKMQAFINDEKWSEGQSGDSKYSFSEMIEFASRDEWVRAGEVFGSGTVATGCGLELDKWIKSGDEIKLIVEKIGELKNIVGKKQE